MTADDYKKLHTIKEVAGILRVSPRTVLRWCHQKRIGYFSVSARVFLIPDQALQGFLEKTRAGRKGPSAIRHRGQKPTHAPGK